MTSDSVLTWILATSIPMALGSIVYLNTHRKKYHKLRYLYERLCVCLVREQIISREDEPAKKAQNLLPEQANFVTSIEFLDEPGQPGKRLMGQLERLSTSIFAGPLATLLIISLFATLPIAIFMLFLLGTFPDLVRVLDGNTALALYVGGMVGVLVSFAVILFFFKIKFEKHLSDVTLFAARWPLWGIGIQRLPANRAIIEAKDDPDYKDLSR